MYYIHADNETAACCRVLKRLSDFTRSRPDEGSRWVVYKDKSRYLGAIYEFTGGKLRKTPDLRMHLGMSLI
jgi:hypothetical protein